jgi:hypothetical protein
VSWPARLVLALSAGLLAACQTAPEPAPTAAPSHADIVRGELAQILAVEYPACGTVRQHSRHDRLDYRVVCDSGVTFRVRVGGDGRVLITPAVGR